MREQNVLHKIVVFISANTLASGGTNGKVLNHREPIQEPAGPNKQF